MSSNDISTKCMQAAYRFLYGEWGNEAPPATLPLEDVLGTPPSKGAVATAPNEREADMFAVFRTKTCAFTLALIVPLLLSGCYDPFMVPVEGGQDMITIHLPFEAGYTTQCMQGTGGSYSHNFRSTLYDIDLDTPNNRDDVVYAPTAGRVRVHSANPSSGFGIHVNIELYDGTYIVLAHLKEVMVPDGYEVWPGDPIGIEGTTGHSTGDHVHIGRHRGRADKDAAQGTSVEGLAFFVKNGAGRREVPATEMRCSLGSGEFYTSVLDSDLEPFGFEDTGETPEDEPNDTPDSSIEDDPDESFESEDGVVTVCLKRASLDSSVNGIRLYAITRSEMDRGEAFYDSSDTLFEVFGKSWTELCRPVNARDDELVAVNGFAWIGDDLGQNPTSYDGKPDWRHFASSAKVYGSATVDKWIHTDTNGDGVSINDVDRHCAFGPLTYYDVNADGPTDFNSVKAALLCP